jgi:hypothetical protein
MAHAICTKRCYYGEREFLLGEILRVDGDKIPVHFAEASEEQIQGQRVYTIPKIQPPAQKALTAHDRLQAGEPVSLSELNGVTKAPASDLIADLI